MPHRRLPESNTKEVANLYKPFSVCPLSVRKASSNMTDPESPNPKPTDNLPPPSSNKVPVGSSASGFSGGLRYPNPPDPSNPDPATLREQWRFAIKQYSRWYSHAWGTAILAGLSFFALGWIIKGSNPLPSFKSKNPQQGDDKDTDTVSSSSAVDEGVKQG